MDDSHLIGAWPVWRTKAACLDMDTELFFPSGATGTATLAQIDQAKAVCLRCPVSAQCLEWALATGQDAGVWGGMSEDERRTERRARQRQRRGGSSPQANDS